MGNKCYKKFLLLFEGDLLKGEKKICKGFWERSEFWTNILLGTNSVKDWPMTNNNKGKKNQQLQQKASYI